MDFIYYKPRLMTKKTKCNCNLRPSQCFMYCVKDCCPKTFKTLPPLNVIPSDPKDKKAAKLMEKLINWQYAQVSNSKMIKTPWGVLMWTPKKAI